MSSLDPAFAATLRSTILRLSRLIKAQRGEDVELTANQMSVLGALAKRGPMTVGDLAAYERVKPPTVTRTITCMAGLGLVERTPDPADGRQVIVSLTEAATELVIRTRAQRDAWLEEQMAALSPQDREILRRAVPVLEQMAGR